MVVVRLLGNCWLCLMAMLTVLDQDTNTCRCCRRRSHAHCRWRIFAQPDSEVRGATLGAPARADCASGISSIALLTRQRQSATLGRVPQSSHNLASHSKAFHTLPSQLNCDGIPQRNAR